MKASYTKLRDGSWGVRCEGGVKKGDVVTVRKKDGTNKDETITAVLWSGNGITLCAIAGRQAGPRPARGEHYCRNGHRPHPGPCCNGQHGGGYDCGADCCELD